MSDSASTTGLPPLESETKWALDDLAKDVAAKDRIHMQRIVEHIEAHTAWRDAEIRRNEAATDYDRAKCRLIEAALGCHDDDPAGVVPK